MLHWNTQTFLLISFNFLNACWEYSRKSYLTLNSSKPNRKMHLKIISLTRWVMTAGESKAKLSTGHFHNQWKLGVFLSKAGTHYRSFNWPWLGSSTSRVAVPDPASGTLKLGTAGSVLSLTLQDLSLTSLPGRYSNLSCSTIFTNDLSPNLPNIMINVLEINQLNTSKDGTVVVQ